MQQKKISGIIIGNLGALCQNNFFGAKSYSVGLCDMPKPISQIIGVNHHDYRDNHDNRIIY